MLNQQPLVSAHLHCLFKPVLYFILYLAIATICIVTPTASISAQASVQQITVQQITTEQANIPPSGATVPTALGGYPLDPPIDIAWSANLNGLSDVVKAFNTARLRENVLLGLSLDALVFPAAESWEAMSNGEKALWLINEERTARGLAPLHGLEANVNHVAQEYADWLLANNAFAHDADGRSPWERLDANPAIQTCHDFLSIAENLYFIGTTRDTYVPLLIERAIYGMLYADAESEWGHRHAMLWTPYVENSGAPDREGFLGIGHARGSYTTSNGQYFRHTDIVVMNFFDPCATWVEPEPVETPQITPTPSPTPSATPTVAPTATPTATPTTSPTSPSTPTPIPPTPPQPTQPVRRITGRVTVPAANAVGTFSHTGVEGVTVVTEAGHETQTNRNGEFVLDGLLPQRYTLTPSKASYAFLPASIEIDLTEGDHTDLIFWGDSGPAGTDLSYALLLPYIAPD